MNEKMDHNKMLKFIEQYTNKLTVDVAKGLEEIANEFKNDPLTHKAILGMIALYFPEHADTVWDYTRMYFYDDRNDDPLEETFKYFPDLKRLIYVKLEYIETLLRYRSYHKAGKIVEDFSEYIAKLSHTIAMSTGEKKTLDEKIEDAIKTCSRDMNRLHDFVVVSNQDKILKGMIALKKSMENLEVELQEFIVRNF